MYGRVPSAAGVRTRASSARLQVAVQHPADLLGLGAVLVVEERHQVVDLGAGAVRRRARAWSRRLVARASRRSRRSSRMVVRIWRGREAAEVGVGGGVHDSSVRFLIHTSNDEEHSNPCTRLMEWTPRRCAGSSRSPTASRSPRSPSWTWSASRACPGPWPGSSESWAPPCSSAPAGCCARPAPAACSSATWTTCCTRSTTGTPPSASSSTRRPARSRWPSRCRWGAGWCPA